jgi:hypothetical protein
LKRDEIDPSFEAHKCPADFAIKFPISRNKFPDARLEFPVPLRREVGWKPLNSPADWSSK